jgi:hypothetical protein
MFNNVHNFITTLFQKHNCLYAEEEKVSPVQFIYLQSHKKFPIDLYFCLKMPLEYRELPEHVKQVILTCLRIRKAQLTDALLIKYSSKHFPTLCNFDWRLKVIPDYSIISKQLKTYIYY